MNLDAAFAAAARRVNEYINRVVGQKLRRMREADQRSRSLTKTGAASVKCGSGTTNQRAKADAYHAGSSGACSANGRSE